MRNDVVSPNRGHGNSYLRLVSSLAVALLFPIAAFGQTHTMPGNNVIPSGGALNVQSGATADFNAGSTVDFTGATVTGLGAGSGTVTNFSAGDLSPLFTTTEVNTTTTPALSFTLSNAGSHQFFGNETGGSAAPHFVQPNFTDLAGTITTAQIPATTVTYADIQNVSTNNILLGRATAGAGVVEEITLGTNLSITGTTLNAAGGGGGTPGGSTTQVQYNNASAFGGITNVTTNGTDLTLAGLSSSALLRWSTDTAFARVSAGVLELNNGTAGQYGTLNAGFRSAGTSLANGLVLTRQTTGTAVANTGIAITGQSDTNGGTNQIAGYLSWQWSDPLNASRTAYADFALVQNAVASASKMRLHGSGGLSVNNTTDPGAGIIAANTGYRVGTAGSTSGTILKSDGSKFTASTETYAAPGTSGNVLTSNGTNWTSAAPTGGGAPTTVDYLVGTADAGLSAEIVVGTTPGGELGGTWASPTIDDSLAVTNWNLTTPDITTGFKIGGAAAAGKIPIGDGTNYVASTPTYPNAAGTSGNVVQSNGTNFTSAQLNTGNLSAVPSFIALKATGVNLNIANNDNAVTVTLPTGFTRWRLNNILMLHPSIVMSTATWNVYTAAAAGGTALLASTTTVAFTSTAENTNGNMNGGASFANSATQSFNVGTIYVRTVTAQGSAATADVQINIVPLP